MLMQFGKLVALATIATVVLSAEPARAQLGFQIDPTQGFPGDTVAGQVNPADVAANCVTTVEELQSRFTDLFVGPFVSGNTEGELPQRFFPDPNSTVYENSAQMAYVLTLFVVLGIAQDIGGAAAGALPQTFIMTFADLLTQDPIGPIGSFDPTTGVGSTTVPDLPPGPAAVVAACVGPVFDIDALEVGIREGGAFLDSIGIQFGPDGPSSPEFEAFAQQFLGSSQSGFELIIEFVTAIGPSLLQPIVAPEALGLQIFQVLPPSPIDIRIANAWRSRTKPGRIIIKGSFETGVFGPNDTVDPADGFALRVTDGRALDVSVDVEGSTCSTNARGRVRCQDPAGTYRVILTPTPRDPDLYTFQIRLTGLDIQPPQVAPITLELDLGIPRAGVAESCKVDAAKLGCRG